MNLATPITAKQIERHTIQSLLEIGRVLAQEEDRQGTDEEAVWALLCEAIQTDRALPDRELALLRNSDKAAWPFETTMTQADQDQRVNERVQSGMPPYDEVMIANVPSAAAIDRAQIVFRWVRYWRAWKRHRKKHWAIIVALAMGVPMYKIKGRARMDSRQAVYRIKNRLVDNILEGLRGQGTI